MEASQKSWNVQKTASAWDVRIQYGLVAEVLCGSFNAYGIPDDGSRDRPRTRYSQGAREAADHRESAAHSFGIAQAKAGLGCYQVCPRHSQDRRGCCRVAAATAGRMG